MQVTKRLKVSVVYGGDDDDDDDDDDLVVLEIETDWECESIHHTPLRGCTVPFQKQLLPQIRWHPKEVANLPIKGMSAAMSNPYHASLQEGWSLTNVSKSEQFKKKHQALWKIKLWIENHPWIFKPTIRIPPTRRVLAEYESIWQRFLKVYSFGTKFPKRTWEYVHLIWATKIRFQKKHDHWPNWDQLRSSNCIVSQPNLQQPCAAPNRIDTNIRTTDGF